MRKIKIIDVWWFIPSPFNSIGCIGIVLIKDEFGNKKAFIGAGKGINEEIDKKIIIDHGAKLHLESLKSIINKFEQVDKENID